MNYKIYEPNFKTLSDRITRLNAKLAKIGVPQVTFKTTGHVDEPHPSIENAVARYLLVEVEGTTAKYNGWEFVATLVHTDDGNIIRSVPGYTVPPEFRDRPMWCDHCKTNRVRRDTYVVRHEDGRTMQVGSSCLEEFIGCNPAGLTKAAEVLLAAYDVCEAAEKTNWLGGHNGLHTYRIDTETYLKNVAAVVIVEGRYVTRKMVQERGAGLTTGQLAYDAMMGKFTQHDAQGAVIHARYPITPEAEKLAADARRFVLGKLSQHVMDAEGLTEDALMANVLGTLKGSNKEVSDFEHNLLACVRSESIEPRLCGVTAYAIEYFRRAQAAARPAAPELDAAGLPRIFNMFKAAGTTLKRPAIRLANEQVHLHMSLAGPASKNAGCIYVKGARGTDAYYGKITPQGKFYASRECPSTVEALLLDFSKDPETIAKQYGHLTGNCCFCGRKLTADNSTEVGYGPVCASKYGLNWGSTERAVSNDILEAHRAAMKAQAEAAPVQRLSIPNPLPKPTDQVTVYWTDRNAHPYQVTCTRAEAENRLSELAVLEAQDAKYGPTDLGNVRWTQLMEAQAIRLALGYALDDSMYARYAREARAAAPATQPVAV